MSGLVKSQKRYQTKDVSNWRCVGRVADEGFLMHSVTEKAQKVVAKLGWCRPDADGKIRSNPAFTARLDTKYIVKACRVSVSPDHLFVGLVGIRKKAGGYLAILGADGPRKPVIHQEVNSPHPSPTVLGIDKTVLPQKLFLSSSASRCVVITHDFQTFIWKRVSKTASEWFGAWYKINHPAPVLLPACMDVVFPSAVELRCTFANLKPVSILPTQPFSDLQNIGTSSCSDAFLDSKRFVSEGLPAQPGANPGASAPSAAPLVGAVKKLCFVVQYATVNLSDAADTYSIKQQPPVGSYGLIDVGMREYATALPEGGGGVKDLPCMKWDEDATLLAVLLQMAKKSWVVFCCPGCPMLNSVVIPSQLTEPSRMAWVNDGIFVAICDKAGTAAVLISRLGSVVTMVPSEHASPLNVLQFGLKPGLGSLTACASAEDGVTMCISNGEASINTVLSFGVPLAQAIQEARLPDWADDEPGQVVRIFATLPWLVTPSLSTHITSFITFLFTQHLIELQSAAAVNPLSATDASRSRGRQAPNTNSPGSLIVDRVQKIVNVYKSCVQSLRWVVACLPINGLAFVSTIAHNATVIILQQLCSKLVSLLVSKEALDGERKQSAEGLVLVFDAAFHCITWLEDEMSTMTQFGLQTGCINRAVQPTSWLFTEYWMTVGTAVTDCLRRLESPADSQSKQKKAHNGHHPSPTGNERGSGLPVFNATIVAEAENLRTLVDVVFRKLVSSNYNLSDDVSILSPSDLTLVHKGHEAYINKSIGQGVKHYRESDRLDCVFAAQLSSGDGPGAVETVISALLPFVEPWNDVWSHSVTLRQQQQLSSRLCVALAYLYTIATHEAQGIYPSVLPPIFCDGRASTSLVVAGYSASDRERDKLGDVGHLSFPEATYHLPLSEKEARKVEKNICMMARGESAEVTVEMWVALGHPLEALHTALRFGLVDDGINILKLINYQLSVQPDWTEYLLPVTLPCQAKVSATGPASWGEVKQFERYHQCRSAVKAYMLSMGMKGSDSVAKMYSKVASSPNSAVHGGYICPSCVTSLLTFFVIDALRKGSPAKAQQLLNISCDGLSKSMVPNLREMAAGHIVQLAKTLLKSLPVFDVHVDISSTPPPITTVHQVLKGTSDSSVTDDIQKILVEFFTGTTGTTSLSSAKNPLDFQRANTSMLAASYGTTASAATLATFSSTRVNQEFSSGEGIASELVVAVVRQVAKLLAWALIFLCPATESARCDSSVLTLLREYREIYEDKSDLGDTLIQKLSRQTSGSRCLQNAVRYLWALHVWYKVHTFSTAEQSRISLPPGWDERNEGNAKEANMAPPGVSWASKLIMFSGDIWKPDEVQGALLLTLELCKDSDSVYKALCTSFCATANRDTVLTISQTRKGQYNRVVRELSEELREKLPRKQKEHFEVFNGHVKAAHEKRAQLPGTDGSVSDGLCCAFEMDTDFWTFTAQLLNDSVVAAPHKVTIAGEVRAADANRQGPQPGLLRLPAVSRLFFRKKNARGMHGARIGNTELVVPYGVQQPTLDPGTKVREDDTVVSDDDDTETPETETPRRHKPRKSKKSKTARARRGSQDGSGTGNIHDANSNSGNGAASAKSTTDAKYLHTVPAAVLSAINISKPEIRKGIAGVPGTTPTLHLAATSTQMATSGNSPLKKETAEAVLTKTTAGVLESKKGKSYPPVTSDEPTLFESETIKEYAVARVAKGADVLTFPDTASCQLPHISGAADPNLPLDLLPVEYGGFLLDAQLTPPPSQPGSPRFPYMPYIGTPRQLLLNSPLRRPDKISQFLASPNTTRHHSPRRREEADSGTTYTTTNTGTSYSDRTKCGSWTGTQLPSTPTEVDSAPSLRSENYAVMERRQKRRERRLEERGEKKTAQEKARRSKIDDRTTAQHDNRGAAEVHYHYAGEAATSQHVPSKHRRTRCSHHGTGNAGVCNKCGKHLMERRMKSVEKTKQRVTNSLLLQPPQNPLLSTDAMVASMLRAKQAAHAPSAGTKGGDYRNVSLLDPKKFEPPPLVNFSQHAPPVLLKTGQRCSPTAGILPPERLVETVDIPPVQHPLPDQPSHAVVRTSPASIRRLSPQHHERAHADTPSTSHIVKDTADTADKAAAADQYAQKNKQPLSEDANDDSTAVPQKSVRVSGRRDSYAQDVTIDTPSRLSAPHSDMATSPLQRTVSTALDRETRESRIQKEYTQPSTPRGAPVTDVATLIGQPVLTATEELLYAKYIRHLGITTSDAIITGDIPLVSFTPTINTAPTDIPDSIAEINAKHEAMAMTQVTQSSTSPEHLATKVSPTRRPTLPQPTTVLEQPQAASSPESALEKEEEAKKQASLDALLSKMIERQEQAAADTGRELAAAFSETLKNLAPQLAGSLAESSREGQTLEREGWARFLRAEGTAMQAYARSRLDRPEDVGRHTGQQRNLTDEEYEKWVERQRAVMQKPATADASVDAAERPGIGLQTTLQTTTAKETQVGAYLAVRELDSSNYFKTQAADAVAVPLVGQRDDTAAGHNFLDVQDIRAVEPVLDRPQDTRAWVLQSGVARLGRDISNTMQTADRVDETMRHATLAVQSTESILRDTERLRSARRTAECIDVLREEASRIEARLSAEANAKPLVSAMSPPRATAPLSPHGAQFVTTTATAGGMLPLEASRNSMLGRVGPTASSEQRQLMQDTMTDDSCGREPFLWEAPTPSRQGAVVELAPSQLRSENTIRSRVVPAVLLSSDTAPLMHHSHRMSSRTTDSHAQSRSPTRPLPHQTVTDVTQAMSTLAAGHELFNPALGGTFPFEKEVEVTTPRHSPHTHVLSSSVANAQHPDTQGMFIHVPHNVAKEVETEVDILTPAPSTRSQPSRTKARKKTGSALQPLSSRMANLPYRSQSSGPNKLGAAGMRSHSASSRPAVQQRRHPDVPLKLQRQIDQLGNLLNAV
ncbi:hypothetical protein DIPPA_11351 [Diplonema papillatum]|nr:hypothetical protein DIPPA_11351 [Diplonema papillatum]